MHWRNKRGETMPDQKTIDLIGYVHTSNKSKMYEKNQELEATAQSVRESQALEMQHHNKLVDQRIPNKQPRVTKSGRADLAPQGKILGFYDSL